MTDYSDQERMLALASLTTGIYVLTVRDGDHRLSRPEDIERIEAAVAAMLANV